VVYDSCVLPGVCGVRKIQKGGVGAPIYTGSDHYLYIILSYFTFENSNWVHAVWVPVS